VKTYRFHWRDGKIEDGVGENVQKAFSALGHGSDEIDALDHHEVIDPDGDDWNLLMEVHRRNCGLT
jgi:hypothetical protein